MSIGREGGRGENPGDRSQESEAEKAGAGGDRQAALRLAAPPAEEAVLDGGMKPQRQPGHLKGCGSVSFLNSGFQLEKRVQPLRHGFSAGAPAQVDVIEGEPLRRCRKNEHAQAAGDRFEGPLQGLGPAQGFLPR